MKPGPTRFPIADVTPLCYFLLRAVAAVLDWQGLYSERSSSRMRFGCVLGGWAYLPGEIGRKREARRLAELDLAGLTRRSGIGSCSFILNGNVLPRRCIGRRL